MRTPPELDLSELPAAEYNHASHISNLLMILETQLVQFSAAAFLIEHCEQMDRLNWGKAPSRSDRQWFHGMFVAARDAAMTVYNFGWTLKTSIPDNLRRCPTFAKKADQELLRGARRDFEKNFKDHASLRHAVGHAAELMQNTDKFKKNAAGGGIVQCNLEYRSLVYTIDGKRVALPITNETLTTLDSIAERTYQGFAPVTLQPRFPDLRRPFPDAASR